MVVHLGHDIPEGYEVDHIDNDCTNDDISNLQLLTIEEHLRKTIEFNTTGRTYTTLICPVCGVKFQRETRQIKSENPKCSRRCNGKSSSNVAKSTVDYDKVQNLLENSYTDKQISEELNISKSSVINYRKANNIQSNSKPRKSR